MARSNAIPVLPFLDPLEPSRVLPRTGSLWWTLNTKAGDRMRQAPHRLSDLERTLEHVRPSLDTYASQGIFTAPNRRALNIGWMTHAYLDLDIYRVPDLVGLSPDQIAGLIREHCRENGRNPPSLIEFSGRGIYLKWLWKAPVPKAAAGKAVAVNRALVRRFASFGADPVCVDVSRILRVIGTVNSKSGEIVRIMWPDPGANVATYDFELFADEVLKYTTEQIRGFRTRRATVIDLNQHRRLECTPAYREESPGLTCWEEFHWKRVNDLMTLAELRFPEGIVQPGQRDLFGFVILCSLALAQVVNRADIWLVTCIPVGNGDGGAIFAKIKNCGACMRRV